jgi:3-oxoacyl-[acyl-carrier protein] reductase
MSREQHQQDRTSEGDIMSFGSHSDRVVAVVTGGALPTGRNVARGLARWAWPVVIVYLDHQSLIEVLTGEIIAGGGTAIAVRANLADDLDVQRLFTESIAEFGGVDVVVHTTANSANLLCRHAARHIRPGGAVVVTSLSEPITPRVASQLREHGITIVRIAPDTVLDHLDRWRNNGG